MQMSLAQEPSDSCESSSIVTSAVLVGGVTPTVAVRVKLREGVSIALQPPNGNSFIDHLLRCSLRQIIFLLFYFQKLLVVACD